MARALVLLTLLVGAAVLAAGEDDSMLIVHSKCKNNTCAECAFTTNYTTTGACISANDKSYNASCTASEYSVMQYTTTDCSGKATHYAGKVGCSSKYTVGKLVVEKRNFLDDGMVDAVILKLCDSSEECPAQCEQGEQTLYPLKEGSCYTGNNDDGTTFSYEGTFTDNKISVKYYRAAGACGPLFDPLFSVKDVPSGTCVTLASEHTQTICTNPKTTEGAHAYSFSVFLAAVGAVLVALAA